MLRRKVELEFNVAQSAVVQDGAGSARGVHAGVVEAAAVVVGGVGVVAGRVGTAAASERDTGAPFSIRVPVPTAREISTSRLVSATHVTPPPAAGPQTERYAVPGGGARAVSHANGVSVGGADSMSTPRAELRALRDLGIDLQVCSWLLDILLVYTLAF